jgi:hypothetical protein
MQEISDECLRVFGALESPATTEDEKRACYRKLEVWPCCNGLHM